jgi:hypothetical protein
MFWVDAKSKFKGQRAGIASPDRHACFQGRRVSCTRHNTEGKVPPRRISEGRETPLLLLEAKYDFKILMLSFAEDTRSKIPE